MSLQFIGAGEAFATEEPVAYKRSLTRMPAQVSTQVTGLSVHFVAAGDVTDVLLLFRLTIPSLAVPAVGTGARDSPHLSSGSSVRVLIRSF